jgi:hypothetical protein
LTWVTTVKLHLNLCYFNFIYISNYTLYLDDITLPKFQSINLSSTIYADLSNSIIEFSLTNIQLCIGSLQIKSLGNFDYVLNNDTNLNIYPNKYHASRLFWSTKNAREKTVYHLHIEIEQTYHTEQSNHQTIEYPLSNERIHLEQLYETCQTYFNKFNKKVHCEKPIDVKNENSNNEIKQKSSYIKCQTSRSILKNISRPRDRFKNEHNPDLDKSSLIISKQNCETIAIDTKNLRNLFINDSFKSSNLSRFALALVQALQHTDRSLLSTNMYVTKSFSIIRFRFISRQEQEPIFSYYLSDPASVLSNGSTAEKKNDAFLEQLLKNINLPQQLNGMKKSREGMK